MALTKEDMARATDRKTRISLTPVDTHSPDGGTRGENIVAMKDLSLSPMAKLAREMAQVFEENKVRCGPGALLVLRIPKEAQTEGGLHIPDIAQEKATVGYVCAVGENVTIAKPGDEVIFSKFFGHEVMLPGCKRPFVQLREEEISVARG